MLTSYNLKMPHAVYGGENAMDNIAAIIKSMNAKKVAMFTDKGLRGLGLFALAEDVVLGRASEEDCIFKVRERMQYMAGTGDADEYLPAPFRKRKLPQSIPPKKPHTEEGGTLS